LLLPICIANVLDLSSSTTVSASVATGEQLTISGTHGTLNLSLEDLNAMPQTSVDAYLTCYGALVTQGTWSGVNLGFLLKQAGVDPNANIIVFTALDGYKVTLNVGSTVRQDIIVATALDGKPLDEWTRLVLPGDNGDRWISMITSISQVHVDPSPQPTVGAATPQPTSQPATPTPTPTPSPEITVPLTSTPSLEATPQPQSGLQTEDNLTSPQVSSLPSTALSSKEAIPTSESSFWTHWYLVVAVVAVAAVVLTAYFACQRGKLSEHN
jgi:DMSO/TMAO reductase YedYZ molybdopterin-dependent catalytic subunit